MKPEWEIFCREFLRNGFNASGAYRKAYPECANKTAGTNGNRLLKNTAIQKRLSKQVRATLNGLDIEVADVLQKLWDAANADPNELVEMRRDCCRYCYGKDNQYQYTPAEWRRAEDDYNESREAAERMDKPLPKEPDPCGGIGFTPLKEPLPECPECFGIGVENIVLKDTRNLSPAALELYAGAKVTKNGIEILTHNRDKNLELIGKYLAMFTDKVDHTSTDGSMTPMSLDDFYATLSTKTKPEPGTS